MWRAWAVSVEGERRSLELAVAEGIPSARNFWELASRLGPEGVPRTFADWTVERSPPEGPWFSPLDGIDIWAETIRGFSVPSGTYDVRSGQDLSGSYLDVLDGGISWDVGGNVIAASWHDRESAALLVPPGCEVIEIEYEPNPQDLERAGFLLSATRGPDQSPFEASDLVVDWAGFFGSNTGVIFGRAVSAVRRGIHSARIRVGGRAGLITARAMRWAGRRVYVDQDPAFGERLRADEAAYSDVTSAIPRLEAALSLQAEHCVILVHGTISTGIRTGRFLHERLASPTYRFEHNTFAPITTNAAELVELIERCVESPRLTLVAHSRGGLLARDAADRVKDRRPSVDVSVVTAGTPHEGTEMVLAAATGGFLYLLEESLKNQHSVSLAFRYLYRAAAPPPGIEAMRPGSDFLELLNRRASDPFALTAFGGRYDFAADAAGAGFRERFADELFDGQPNDLVVAEDSAIARGNGVRVSGSCAHSDYFMNPDVLKTLQQLDVID